MCSKHILLKLACLFRKDRSCWYNQSLFQISAWNLFRERFCQHVRRGTQLKEISVLTQYNHDGNMPFLVPATFATSAPVLQTGMLKRLLLSNLASTSLKTGSLAKAEANNKIFISWVILNKNDISKNDHDSFNENANTSILVTFIFRRN